MTSPARAQTTRPRKVVALAVLAAGLLLAGACSRDDSDDSFEKKSTTTEKTTTTEASTTSDTGDKDDSASPDQSGAEPWSRTAQDLRGEVGTEVEFECPAGGRESAVWGVNVYTDDSSVCTAAVQMGLITLAGGGDVKIEVLDGRDFYDGGEANGITSSRYGEWGGSFEFPGAEPLDVGSNIDWGTPALEFKGRDETTFTVGCPPDGTPGSLWGSNPYTEDSSICTAGAHTGVITVKDGGKVTFTLTAGQESYEGSEANGVTSADYGSYGGSFRIDE